MQALFLDAQRGLKQTEKTRGNRKIPRRLKCFIALPNGATGASTPFAALEQWGLRFQTHRTFVSVLGTQLNRERRELKRKLLAMRFGIR